MDALRMLPMCLLLLIPYIADGACLRRHSSVLFPCGWHPGPQFRAAKHAWTTCKRGAQAAECSVKGTALMCPNVLF